MIVGIDIGGTNIQVGSLPSVTSRSLEKSVVKIHNSFSSDIKSVIRDIKKLRGKNTIETIGIGVPGSVDTRKGFIIHCANLLDWDRKPIADILRNEFNCPVKLENDAATAALGESLFGKGKNKEFTYVVWGTGMGGARVVWKNGKPIARKLHWYRYFRTWEKHCGGNSIERKYKKPAEKLADKEWDTVMSHFASELTKFTAKTNPSHIVFGGGITTKQLSRLRNIANGCIKPDKSLTIEASSIGDNAGLFGAMALFSAKQI